MSLLMLLQFVQRGVVKVGIDMRLHARLRLWVGLAASYLIFMGFVYLLQVPLRSNTLHSHYDLSAEGVGAKHHEVVRKEAEKYAQAALRIPKIDMDVVEQIRILTETFKKADTNGDRLLELTEISAWISTKIKEHLTLALKENFFMFTAIDLNPRNGMVSWDEYHRYFLKQHGYTDEFIDTHKDNHKGMPRELKEAIMRDKASWSEAARNNPEQLTIDEFLAFRHPESSHATILNIVEETIGRLDLNEDGALNEDEFSDPDLNEVPDDMTEEQFKLERLDEFRVADEDKNGKIERRELLNLLSTGAEEGVNEGVKKRQLLTFKRYIDPRNIHHAEKDAVTLLTAADANEDAVLTLKEVLAKKEIFITSKMVDAARSFHDEF